MNKLPEPWHSVYAERQSAIRHRLHDFANISATQYFYELTFCVLTPQSSAKNADATISELIRDDFHANGFDPMPYLRDPRHYIRFHNVKAKRLLEIRSRFGDILPYLLNNSLSAEAKRELILANVKGLGMKEASHFLRNIGVKGLAILDRHIFKHLKRLGIIDEVPKSGPTKKQYLAIENEWRDYANRIGISIDELDLLFWSMETGEIRK